MANKITFELDAKVDKVKAAAAEIGRAFNNINLPDSIRKDLGKTFEKLTAQIGDYEAKAKTASTTGDFTKTLNSGQKILEIYEHLKSEVKDLGKLSNSEIKKFFPEEITNNIKEATKELGKYRAQLEKTTKIKTDKTSQRRILSSELDGKYNNRIIDGKKTQVANAKSALERAGITDAESTKAALNKEIKAKQSALKSAQGYVDKIAPGQKINKTQAETLANRMVDIEKLPQIIQDLNSKLELINNYEIKLGDLNETTAQSEKLKQQIADIDNELRQLDANDGKALNDFFNILEKSGVDVSQFSRDLTGAEQALKSLTDEQLDKITSGFKQFEENVRPAGEEFEKFKQQLEDARIDLTSFDAQMQQVNQLKQRIAYFFSLTSAVQIARRAITSAMNTVKELDKTMTETAVVTDFSIGDMWDQLPMYTKNANELGVSINGMYEATTLYYQQGLKTQAAMELSTETLKMAKIAGLDAATATDRMTAALRGFNMELNQVSAQRIDDVYSKLAAITASDVNEISVAMTKTASIANSANMEFETTAAFLSQIIETTRESAETAGTAMKTVIARFTELKKDPSQIGEVEGEIVDANKIETALRSVGVALRNEEGQFRDLDDVFIELSSKWKDLDTNTQRYVATIAAGSRQQSRFIAMMQNYDRTMELVNAANTAAGASTEQFDKTLESLETKLQRLKNSWDTFTMNLANSDILKGAVDILNGFLTVINKIIEALSSGDSTVATYITALMVLGGYKLGKSLITIFDKAFTDLIARAYQRGKQLGQETARGVQDGVNQKNAKFRAGVDKAKNGISNRWNNLKEVLTARGDGNVVIDEENLNKLKVFDPYAATSQLEDDEAHRVSALAKKTYAGKLSKEEANELSELTNGQINFKEATISIDKVSSALNTMGMAAGTAGIAINGLAKLLKDNTDAPEWLTVTLEALGKTLMGLSVILPIVGTAVQVFCKTTEMAVENIPIIGWIIAIIAALITLIQIFAKLHKTQKEQLKDLQDNVKKATEATEEANKTLDELLKGRDEYKELQKQLEDLTYGTDEWNQALIKANQNVLDLIEKYPVLADYIQNGEYGELGISEKGWDAVIQNQRRKVGDRVVNQAMSQRDLALFENQVARDDIKRQYSNVIGEVYSIDYLADQYRHGQLDDGVFKYYDEVKEYVKTIDKNAAKIATFNKQIVDNSVSEKTKQYEQYEEIKGGLANSIGLDYDTAKTEVLATSHYNTSDAFKKVAQKYGILETDLTGNNTSDLNKVYAAIMNISLSEAASTKKAAKQEEIAKAYQRVYVGDTIDNVVDSLTKMDRSSRNKYNMLLSEGGRLFTADKVGQYDIGSLNIAEDFGLDPEETTKLTEAIKKNIEAAAQELAENEELVEHMSFSLQGIINEATSNWTLGQQNDFYKKIDQVFYTIGDEGAQTFANYYLDMIDSGLSETQKQAFARIMSDIDITDQSSLDTLKASLKNLIPSLTTKQIEDFTNKLSDLGDAFYKLDLESLIKQLQKTGSIIQKIQSGDQMSSFSEEDYKTLIAANKELSQDFVQDLDGNYIYLGHSIYDLILALQDNTKALLGKNTGSYDIKNELIKSIMGQGYDTFLDNFYTYTEADQKENIQNILETFANTGQNTYDLLGINTATLTSDDIKNYVDNIFKDSEMVQNFVEKLINAVGTADQNQIDLNTNAAKDEELQSKIAQYQNDYGKIMLGIDTAETDDLEARAKALIAIARSSGITEEQTMKLSNALESNNTQLQLSAMQELDVAIAYKKTADLIDKYTDSINDNIEAYANTDNAELRMMNLGAIISDINTILGTSLDKNFLNTEENLNNLNKAINGDNEAWMAFVENAVEAQAVVRGFNELRDIHINVDGQTDLSNLFNGLNQAEDKVKTLLDNLANLGFVNITYNTDDQGNITSAQGYQKAVAGFLFSDDYKNKKSGSKSKDPWIADYDWLYNLVKKINLEMRKRNQLEKEHEKILRNTKINYQETYDQLKANQVQQQKALSAQRQMTEYELQKRKEQAQVIMDQYKAYRKYAWFDEDNQVQINYDAIQAVSGKPGNNYTGEMIDAYIKELETVEGQIQDAEDSLMEIEDATYNLSQQGKDEFLDIESRLIDAIEKLRQDEIDNLQDINDSVNETNEKLVSKIQEGLNEYRDQREKDKQLQDIQDMEERVALLGSDTSGASYLDLLATQEQLDDARQSYTDSLIDKSIEEMTKQNEEAAEQRQMQIDLMQATLEFDREVGNLAAQANGLMENIQMNSTIISDIISKAEREQAMGFAARADFEQSLKNSLAEATIWKNYQSNETIVQLSNNLTGSLNSYANSVSGGISALSDKINHLFTTTGPNYGANTYTPPGGTVRDGYPTAESTSPDIPSTEQVTMTPKILKTLPNGVYTTDAHLEYTQRAIDTFGMPVRPGSYTQAFLKSGNGFKMLYSNGYAVIETYVSASDLATAIGNKGIVDHGIISDQNTDENYRKFIEKFWVPKYATGGLNTTTGPAWLDGTKAHPEYVLNAKQTEGFLKIANAFDTNGFNNTALGNNYYNIEIQVDELGNDYDVDRLAERVERKIVDDARGRNTNAVDLGR